MMSPEVLSEAMEEYLKQLRFQASVAKSFFFGRFQEGMRGLLKLPEDIQLRVDQLIWEVAQGEPLNPTEKDAQSLIAAAVMRSLEERMGII